MTSIVVDETNYEKSTARARIKQIIADIDVSDFDATPWSDENIVRPLPGAQERFLMSDAQIVFYGGAAGSGKSEGLVLDQLSRIQDPNFESVTFRRNTKSLKGAGGIFNKAGKVYKRLGAEQKLVDLMYEWPSGATSRYRHLEHNERTAEDDHQGLEYSAIYFDEIGRFNRAAVFYMMSRMRSNAEGQSVMRATCNPEPLEAEGGWLHEFLDGFYLDDYGYPIPERSGVIRWFVSDDDGNLDWADDADTLRARHGIDCEPMSFTFIAANIADNLVLCKLQPGYLTALKNLGRVERERLLYGCWNVAPQGSGYFKREWVEFVDRKQVPKLLKTVRAWDLAASVVSEINTDPDWTAGVLIGVGEDGYFYVLNAVEALARPAGVQALLKETAQFDGKNCPVSLPQDAGQAGIIAFEHYARPLILSGFKVKRAKTRKGKLERFSGFSNAAENGLVRIVRGPWNEKYISQLENFDPDRKKQHDDYVDGTADGYNWLVTGRKLPDKFSFKPSGMTKVNQFANMR